MHNEMLQSGLTVLQVVFIVVGTMLIGTGIRFFFERWMNRPEGGYCFKWNCGKPGLFFVNRKPFCSWDHVPMNWRNIN